MRGSRKTAGSKSRRQHTIHVAPITRAVRAALAASAIALVGTGAAYAGDCGNLAQVQLVRCAPETAAVPATTPVVDLTAIADRHVPSAVNAAGTATAQASALAAIDIVNSGTISESGSGTVVGLDADYPGSELSVTNRGEIYADSVDGVADGIFAYGASVSVNNAQQGTIDVEGYTWAAGIEAQGETVNVNNAGSITATATAYANADPEAGTPGVYGHAYGIYAAAAGGDGVVVNNRGSIDVTGPYATGIFAYDGGTGGVDVTNRGDITATAADGFATGINAVTNVEGSDASVVNRGSIEATGMNGATGIVVSATGAGSSASVNNAGDIYAAATVYYSIAEGIVASADGDATARNSGTITIGYGDYAYGAAALAFAGDASVQNSGDITVNGGLVAYGALAASQNGVAEATNTGTISAYSTWSTAVGLAASGATGTYADNRGDISVDASSYGFGIQAVSGAGDVQADNSGSITAASGKYAIGIFAQSVDGDVEVNNSGTIATDGKYSFGVLAQSTYGDVTVDNSGSLAGSGKYAYGAVAASNFGDALIGNAEGATISAYSGDLLAVGAFVNANYDGNATIDNAGIVSAEGAGYAQIAYGAVVQTDAGTALVTNSGGISATNSYGAARGVIARSSAGGDVTVDNSGSIQAISTGTGIFEGYYGTYTVNTDVIGIYAYAPGGAATVYNDGKVAASTEAGLADGIFAAGETATVVNSGSISADGYAWAAGIEAQGDSTASVVNTGDINANATAFALGDPEAGTPGVYGRAYGIYAAGGDGGVTVDNQGTIAVTGALATGIHAYGSGGGNVQVVNSGDIVAGDASSLYATGIRAVSAQPDVDVSVDNSGSVNVEGGYLFASGILALGEAGATASNSGTVNVASDAGFYGAFGIQAISSQGDALADNSGLITVSSGEWPTVGAYASGATANVSNSGQIDIDATFIGYGAVAVSQAGTAGVTNDGAISIDTASGAAIGTLAEGAAGATVNNTGTIDITALTDTFGIIGTSSTGDVSVDNSGAITVFSDTPFNGNSNGISVAAMGDALVDNSGVLSVAGGKYATGISASSEAGDVLAYNSGSITVDDAKYATGIQAVAETGDVLVANDEDGSVSATTREGFAIGLAAVSQAGDVQVDNAGAIAVADDLSGADYAYAMDAIGIYAVGGNVVVDNSGKVVAASTYGLADGIFAAGETADVTNSGSISADGYTWAAGIEAQGDDAVSVVNTGDVNANATAYVLADPEAGTPGIYGHAYGVYATGGDGGVTVDNQGTIYATGPYATGVFAYDSGTGGAWVGNSGEITAVAADGFAAGIKALTNVEGSSIQVQNDEGGIITATGMNGATGISAVATGLGSSASVDNAGSIYAATTVYYSSAEGIAVSADGDAAISNSGDITIGYGDYAYGALALAFAGDANVYNSGTVEVNGGLVGYGVVAASQNGYASVTNVGSISADSSFNTAAGIAASSYAGTRVDNEGEIDATASKYAFGVLASSGQGDTVVDNDGTITTDGKYSFGVWAQSGDGDSVVVNNGSIAGAGKYGYGAVATSTFGDSMIYNAGSLEGYSADLLAVGAFANASNAGYAVINNQGTIAATGTGYALVSYGAVVRTNSGTGLVTNGDTGEIVATNSYAGARAAIVRSAYGDAAVDNAGSIVATATGPVAGEAIGVYVEAPNGYAVVSNYGSIQADTALGMADGVFATGAAAYVFNEGSISANGYYWGSGIEAQGDGLAWVQNSGDISASAIAYAPADPEAGTEAVYGHAYGVYATGGDGGVYVGNRGTIAATGPYATGIYSYGGGTGAVGISNRGDVTATAENGIANGINAVTVVSGTGIEVVNRGSVDAFGMNLASGISALAGGEGSGIAITNSGDISAVTTPDYKYGVASGIAASGDGDVSIRNAAAGSIYASAAYMSYGALSLAFAGDSTVVNAGDITTVTSSPGLYAFSYGVVSSSQNGLASATNTGSISATASGLISVAQGISATGVDVEAVNRGSIETFGKYSRGISAIASEGDVTATNQGTIYAGGKYTYGVAGISTDGDVRVTNGAQGTVEAYSYGAVAVGLLGISSYDNVEVVNAGGVAAFGDSAGLVAGIYASSDGNDVSAVNRGTIDANSVYGSAFGVLANVGGNDELSVDNRGAIYAASTFGHAVGIEGAAEGGGDAVLRNRSLIEASSGSGDAIGISGIVSGGDLTLANTAAGSITATAVDGDAIGLLATLTDANVTINNAGSISVSSDTGSAYAIHIVDGAAPVAPASAGSATIANSGTIVGDIVTGGGNDRMTNKAGGTWRVTGTASSFGAGDDTFNNAAGARLELADAGISFGAGNNRFVNNGVISVSGASLIDMTDGSEAAVAAALKRPKGGAPFTNNGIIDLLDGAADDSLTVIGGFAGQGAINLDVSLGNRANDQLIVQGGVGNGTKQVVNVALLEGLPKSSDVGTQLELVHVSGDTNPSVFVAGDVLGISPRDFLAMGMTLSSHPDKGAKASGNGSSYMLTVKTEVKGLNAAGVLASSAALGVDSLMTSTVGDWRERNHSLTAMGGKPLFASITPWVRGFRDEGGMSPDHLSGNFGQLANSRVGQDNFGTEMGLQFQGANGFSFGTTFAKAEGKQYLLDERGMDTIRGSTVGLYGTWVSPTGFYVDASWRSMQFEANIDSIGGRQRSDGNAVTTNVEAGYTWQLANGLSIEPQLRYTTTSIDGLRIDGDQATFESREAQWKRASAGFAMSKSYGGGSGWRWTPYGEFTMMRTIEGVASYTINDDYFGNVMTEGTSALVKFGLGAQKGRFSWNGGFNWMDGASFDSVLGGQVSLQYSW